MSMSEQGLILKASTDEARCDSYRVGGAIVDHDAISGLWRMWYYCRDRAFGGPATLGTGYIAHARSEDGIHWTRVDGDCEKGAVFAPSTDPAAFDSVHVGLTDVTRGAGEWLMWYFGGDATPRDNKAAFLGGPVAGLGMRPGLARSQDGVHWERVSGALANGALIDFPADDMYASWPNVIHDGQRYVMQYTAPTLDLGYFHTRVAVSTDGRTWDGAGELNWADGVRGFDEGGLVTRQILPNPLPGGRRFLMIYTATDKDHKRAVAAADSDNALDWYHLYEEPIFETGPEGAWDSYGVAANRLVVAGDQLYFYYYGFQSLTDPTTARGIGLAVCPVGNLRKLTRVTA